MSRGLRDGDALEVGDDINLGSFGRNLSTRNMHEDEDAWLTDVLLKTQAKK